MIIKLFLFLFKFAFLLFLNNSTNLLIEKSRERSINLILQTFSNKCNRKAIGIQSIECNNSNSNIYIKKFDF